MKLKYSPSSLSRSGQVIHTRDLLDGEECYKPSKRASWGIVWWTKRGNDWFIKYPSLKDPGMSEYHKTMKPYTEVTIA
jgi:hypothetical protein